MADDLKGMEEFRNLLEKTSNRLSDPREKEKILKPAADYVAKQTTEALRREEYLRKRSKRLSEAGLASEWKPGSPDETLVGWVDLGTAPYGWFQERGFYHAGSGRFVHNPHLEPTFDKEQDHVFQMMEDKVKEIIDD